MDESKILQLAEQLIADGFKVEAPVAQGRDVHVMAFRPVKREEGPDEDGSASQPESDKDSVEFDSIEGANLFLENMKQRASHMFDRDGKIGFPMLSFLIQRDPGTLKLLERPGLMLCPVDPNFFEGPESRNRLNQWMATFARKTDAFGFAMLTENWLSSTAPDDPNTSLENVPGRWEVAMITAQHRAWGPQTYSIFARILRDATGKPTLEAWSEKFDAGGNRFCDVLFYGSDESERMLRDLANFKALGMTKEQMLESLAAFKERLVAEDKIEMAQECDYLAQRIREQDL